MDRKKRRGEDREGKAQIDREGDNRERREEWEGRDKHSSHSLFCCTS